MNLQHILVPVDLTEHGHGPMHCALEVARKFAARITLCHVHQRKENPFQDLTLGAFESGMQKRAERALHKLAKAVGPVIPVDTIFEWGVPWESILRIAKREEVDLIVMGNHGCGGSETSRGQSCGELVVKDAVCPVLVLRESSQPGCCGSAECARRKLSGVKCEKSGAAHPAGKTDEHFSGINAVGLLEQS